MDRRLKNDWTHEVKRKKAEILSIMPRCKGRVKARGRAKVTGPFEAGRVSPGEAPESDMMWDRSLKHVLVIFTECWGAGRGITEHRE